MYTVTQADLDAGVTNTATAKANTRDQRSTARHVCDRQHAAQSPQLAVTKSSGPDELRFIGEVIHYTLWRTNDGNVTLTTSRSATRSWALTCTQPVDVGPTQGAHLHCQPHGHPGRPGCGRVLLTSPRATGTPPDRQVTDDERRPGDPDPAISRSQERDRGQLRRGRRGHPLHDRGDQRWQRHPEQRVDQRPEAWYADLHAAGDARPAETLTCTGSHTVTQADLDAGDTTTSPRQLGTTAGW